ncbi:MAG TPA: phage baseplate assembly protein V [Bryobacteraceae bacterium]|nr:phage baseplate assembly protein V [Bryobacteraceae bacterium]
MSAFDLSSPGQTSGVSRRIEGVVVGIVIDNQDPQGLARVKVKFPWLSDDDIGHWARIAVLMAGNQRGTYFLPEVGDEVLVAFELGDVAKPYVLGGLWNGVDAPPETNSNGSNDRRLIKSRSGHLVRLDDTNGSEKIEIIDKSGNNSITVDASSNTITIQSNQDINIQAPQGKIKLSAQNVEISSTADTKVQAQGGLTLDGSPGNTTIKGSMVNIN